MKRVKLSKIGLLPRVIIAIILGVLCGTFFPDWAVRCFVTFNSIFSHFLSFLIPLIIVGLVTPAIADIGKGAGKLLLITALIELITRKKLDPKYEGYIHAAGMVLLLALMAYVMFHDIFRIVTKT